MKENRPIKATAWYSIAVGIMNIGTWAFLLFSGNVTEFETEPAAFGFHWLSELTTAIMLIVSGMILLKHARHAIQAMFLSLGLLVMAIMGAFIYYMLNFEVVIFAISALVTGSTIIFIILNYRSFKDFIMITQGALIYALLNITGKALQSGDLSLLSMSVPVLLFVMIIAINLIGKEIIFMRPKHVNTKTE